MEPYAALMASFVLCGIVAAVMVCASWILGPKNPTPTKLEIFETGNPPMGSLRGMRFPVKFYLVAIFFVVFDVEVVFLYPWALIFRQLGWAGLVEMAIFMAILGAGLAYVWQVGALEWD